MSFLTGFILPSFVAGWLLDTDVEDDNLPWYMSGAITVIMLISGAVLGLIVLTRFGFFDFLLGIVGAYFQFVVDVLGTIAKPITRLLL